MGWVGFGHGEFQFGLEAALGASYGGPQTSVKCSQQRLGSPTATRILGCRSTPRPRTECGPRRSRRSGLGARSARSPIAAGRRRTSPRRCFGSGTRASPNANWSSRATGELAVIARLICPGSPASGWRSAMRTRRCRGCFFPAPGSVPGEPRPLVIMNNGSDGASRRCWSTAARRRVSGTITDGFRRAWSADGIVRAKDRVSSGLGGRAHAGGRRDAPPPRCGSRPGGGDRD